MRITTIKNVQEPSPGWTGKRCVSLREIGSMAVAAPQRLRRRAMQTVIGQPPKADPGRTNPAQARRAFFFP